MAEMPLEQAWPTLFTRTEQRLLFRANDPATSLRSRQGLPCSSDAAEPVWYVADGFLGHYQLDRAGRRQCVGISVPGDFLGLSALMLGRSDRETEALGPALLRPLSAARLRTLEGAAPETFGKLWQVSLIDSAISRYWIYRIGRLGGRARIANFLAEMLMRLHARGLCGLDGVDLPLTQTDLAEACGMTPVHVNRMLGELRQDGICTLVHGTLRIQRLAELVRIGQFRWDYLHLGRDLDGEIRDRLRGVTAGGPAVLRTGLGRGIPP